MARRRRHKEEHENHERWLVSYADFITLLFAFFVVMYAVSSVNEGKYRVLSETLNAVFTVQARSDDPIQIGEPPRDMLASPEGPLSPKQSDQAVGGEREQAKQGGGDAYLPQANQDSQGSQAQGARYRADGIAQRLVDELSVTMSQYIDQGLVRINRVGDRVEIEMKDRMLFGSGDARLAHDALQTLRVVGNSLVAIPSHIQVEGHTDNVPISTTAFPSNWELSAARAASVVHFLTRAGVEPWRLSAVGLGEYQPIADNDTPEGRAANRRVVMVVLTGKRLDTDGTEPDVPWAEGPAPGAGR